MCYLKTNSFRVFLPPWFVSFTLLKIVDVSTLLLLFNIALSCPQVSPVSSKNVLVAIEALRGLQLILLRVWLVSRSTQHAKKIFVLTPAKAICRRNAPQQGERGGFPPTPPSLPRSTNAAVICNDVPTMKMNVKVQRGRRIVYGVFSWMNDSCARNCVWWILYFSCTRNCGRVLITQFSYTESWYVLTFVRANGVENLILTSINVKIP